MLDKPPTATEMRVYIGTCPFCGAVPAMWVDNPADRMLTRRRVGEMIGDGLQVTSVSESEARTYTFSRCKCGRRVTRRRR